MSDLNIDLKIFDKNKKYILAVSGGVDSMAMLYFFYSNNFNIIVAHCNFQLRGEDSNADEMEVSNWCNRNGVVCVTKKFETETIVANEKKGIQEVARKLRYDFFNEVMKEYKCDYILTAHHQNDQIETVLFRFLRGTGIKGLVGIPFCNNNIMRPLLHISKDEILQYVKANNIQYREDSSNAKTDYSRNKIRLEILPLIQKYFPTVNNNIAHNATRLHEAYTLYQQQIDTYKKKLVEKRGNEWYIPIRKLQLQKPINTICYELIAPFGFHYEQAQQLIEMIHSESGKYIENYQYKILKDKTFFIIATKDSLQATMLEVNIDDKEIATTHFTLKISTNTSLNYVLLQDENIAQLDMSKLEFPIVLRKWKQGDYMYPLGLNKKKKIAKILIDKKIPQADKEKVWVLESNKKIVWLVGLCIDHRYRIQNNSKEIYKVLLLNNK